MENHEINLAFLNSLSAGEEEEILYSIALRYGRYAEQIEEEITEDGAEHLLDYMVEPCRTATYLKMRQWAKSAGLINVWGRNP